MIRGIKILFFGLLVSGMISCGDKPKTEKITAVQTEAQQAAQATEEIKKGMAQVQAKMEQYGSIEAIPAGSTFERLISSRAKEDAMQKMGEDLQAELNTLAADYASGKITEEQYEERHKVLLAKLEDLKNTASKYMERVKKAVTE